MSVFVLANPAATGDEKIGLPKGTRSLLTRITSVQRVDVAQPRVHFPGAHRQRDLLDTWGIEGPSRLGKVLVA